MFSSIIAVKGVVYDVSPGKQFYGPGGPYENFAGRDASRGLAKGSFEMDQIKITGPIDDLSDLNDTEQETLDGWEEHFKFKYNVVGSLVEG